LVNPRLQGLGSTQKQQAVDTVTKQHCSRQQKVSHFTATLPSTKLMKTSSPRTLEFTGTQSWR